MYCQNKIIHVVEEGDSLYKLARQYRTTVTELILGNPGVNPYNLQIGMQLNVCPGEEFREPENQESNRPQGGRPQITIIRPTTPGGGTRPTQPEGTTRPTTPGSTTRPTTPESMTRPTTPESTTRPTTPESMTRPTTPGENTRPTQPGNAGNTGTPEQERMGYAELRDAMRLAWLAYIYWTRMYLMSVDANTADQQEVFERMLQTADEIVDAFAPYLPTSITRQLQNLLMEHMELTGQLIRILKTGQTADYDSLIKDWYGNANQIATLLGNQNPYFDGRELRNLLLNHLDMTREEIEYQLNEDYGRSIDTFRDILNQVLEMADFFATGLLAR